MKTEALADSLQREVSKEIRVLPEGTGRLVVSTPFTFEDGDEYVILLKNRDGRWAFSDEGHTYMHLSYDMDERDWQRGTRDGIIRDTLAMYDVQEQDGELIRLVKGTDFSSALFDYLQALNRITDITFLSREIVRSTFAEDLRSFIHAKVSSDSVEEDWHHPVFDPAGFSPVDYRINHRETPLFVFAITSDEKAKEATITLFEFEKWGVPNESIGVFENQENINRRALARFSDVADKLFSSLPANKERLERYLSGSS